MGLFALFIIPYLLIIAVPGVVLVGMLIRGLTLPRGLRRGAATACGKCMHETTTISEESPLPHRCPECGMRYAKAGVLSLRLAKKSRPGMVSVLCCWTLLALGFASIAITVVGAFTANAYASATTSMAFSQTLASVRTDGGASVGAPGYEVRFDGDIEYAYGSPVSQGTLALTFRPDSGPAVKVEVDLVTASWTRGSEAGLRFDRSAALAALDAAGVDTSKSYVIFEADRLVDAVQFITQQPDTAAYSVLNSQNQAYQSAVSVPQNPITSTTWYPTSLDVTSQSGDTSRGLLFGFESDTLDMQYAGVRSNTAFDGQIEFAFTSDMEDQAIDVERIKVSIRPSEGWPSTLVYVIADESATINSSDPNALSTSTFTGTSQEAFEVFADAAGVQRDENGGMDSGVLDLIQLVHDIEQTPKRFDQTPTTATTFTNSGIQSTENPPGDGVPDGGFIEARPSTQRYGQPYTAAQFPLGMMIASAVSFLLYAGGIVGIVIRRFTIYPAALVGE